MDLIKKYRKTPQEAAFFASLLAGYLAHNFALVNVMHNIDDIGNQPIGYGVGLTSGRWLLTLLGDFSQKLGLNFNLPFLNGVLFLVLAALAAGVLVSLFQVKNRSHAALIGMLLAVFPSAATVLLYRFTSAFYGLAFLLAVLAAWVRRRHKWGVLLSAGLLCLSLGIYQAYVSVTIGIFILLLIRQTLDGETTVWELVCQGLRDCLALVLGLILYFLCLKVCLKLYGTALSSYNGMDNMAGFALNTLPAQVVRAFVDFCKFPLSNYCSLSGSRLIKIAYLLLAGVTALQLGYLLVFRVKNALRICAVCVLLLLFPVGVNFVEIMSPDAWMYTMMVYSFVLVPCVPLLLMEYFPEKALKVGKIPVIAVAILICGYAYQTNVSYTANYYVNRQVENYVTSIVTQVRMTEGYDADKKWALLGEIHDPLLDSPWQYELSNGGLFDTQRTLNDISQYYWFWTYVGYRLPEADPETVEALRTSAEVKSMPCWPAEGSIQVVGDTVVIKFEE